MKKSISMMVLLAAVTAGSLFAEGFSVSAGGGGFIGGDFGGGVEGEADGVKMTLELPYFGGGGFIFVDATYAELSLAIFGGGGKYKMTMEAGGVSQSDDVDSSYLSFNIGLLGKYPFGITDKLSLFPLLGIDYQIMLSSKADGEETVDSDGNKNSMDFSALWFKLGVGLDFEFIPKLYGRLEALYGLRLANKAEGEMKDAYDMPGVDVKTRLGHGLTVKLAIGYKFF
jgi:hypothetical protein